MLFTAIFFVVAIPLMVVLVFPFVLYQSIRLALDPSLPGVAALGLALATAALLVFICLIWYARRVSLHALHDGLYATRGCALEVHDVDDYVGDSLVLDWFYHPADLSKPPQRRANAIRMLRVRPVQTSLVTGQRPISDPITYTTGLGFGLSYILLPDEPGKLGPVRRFVLAHELAHARHQFNPTLIDTHALRAAPYALTLLWIAIQTPWSWPIVLCYLVLLWLQHKLPGWADQVRPMVRLYREIDADRIALLASDAQAVAAVGRLLDRYPDFLADDLLPDELRNLRRQVLKENIARRQSHRELLSMPELGYLPRYATYSFRLVTIALAVLAGGLGEFTSTLALLALATVPLAVIGVLVFRGYLRVTRQIKQFITTSYSLALAAEVTDRAMRELGLRTVPAKPPGGTTAPTVRTRLDYDYDARENVVHEVLDLFATGDAGTGLRVSLLVNRPPEIARREIEGLVWSTDQNGIAVLDNALRGSFFFPVHIRPERVPQLAELYGFFKLVVAYRQRYVFSLDQASSSDAEHLLRGLDADAAGLLDMLLEAQPDERAGWINSLFTSPQTIDRAVLWRTLTTLALAVPDQVRRERYRRLITEVLLVLREHPDGAELVRS